MSDALALRTAVLEWATRSAAGALSDLEWVDTDLSPDRTPHAVHTDAEGRVRFSHLPYTRFLPGPVAEEMAAAQGRGELSAMEAVMLVMARPEWLVLARPLLWTPNSPEPRLLAWLLERWGVEAEVHRHDPERLARIAARLPGWRPHRGSLRAARELHTEGLGEPLTFAVVDRREGGPAPERPALRDEVFTCREDRWWAMRRQPGAAPALRVEGGALRFQPLDGPLFELAREDVLADLGGGRRVSRQLLRLLPAWASLRIVKNFTIGA